MVRKRTRNIKITTSLFCFEPQTNCCDCKNSPDNYFAERRPQERRCSPIFMSAAATLAFCLLASQFGFMELVDSRPDEVFVIFDQLVLWPVPILRFSNIKRNPPTINTCETDFQYAHGKICIPFGGSKRSTFGMWTVLVLNQVALNVACGKIVANSDFEYGI